MCQVSGQFIDHFQILAICLEIVVGLRSFNVLSTFLEPGINKCFYVRWRCMNSSWMATRTAASVAAAEFLLDLCPWAQNVSTVNESSRIGVTFWARIRSLFHGVSRAWNSEPSLTHVLKLRFGHILEQNIPFGRHKVPRSESTFWKNTSAFQNLRFACCVLKTLRSIARTDGISHADNFCY